MVDNPTSFFAVALDGYETPQNVAMLIIRTAHEEGLLFWGLEALDLIEIGSSRFLRVKSDLVNLVRLRNRLLARGRTVISLESNTYILRKPNGKFGTIPMLTMHGFPRPGQQRAYRGTKQWEAGLAS